MKFKYYGKLINTKTKGRCDVTTLFQDPKVFNNLIKDLIKPFQKETFNKIVAIDALGFILGGAIALKTKKSLVLIRKSGKLPNVQEDLIKTSFKDYSNTEKSFEIIKNSIKNGDSVLIVDEWIETGSQIKAAISLIEGLGGKVIGISSIQADKNNSTDVLFKKYNLKPIKIHET
jgi:adenine phosphoribosyltransferase